MKYMGSKRWMLQNGLGDILRTKSFGCTRFIDLFAGSGAVATHMATKYPLRCYAYDIQSFSAVLSGAIIGRSSQIPSDPTWSAWEERAKKRIKNVLRKIPSKSERITRVYVEECRAWCQSRSDEIVTSAYGGHYYSPEQALWIDALRETLPVERNQRLVALAALIQAASQCAASPGHTAQPFQPTKSSKEFIRDAWRKNIPDKTRGIFSTICQRYAFRAGGATVRDANSAVKGLYRDDLVFIDPPYSGVHYSRFYHVLETIARGACSGVSGTGRYPLPEERPVSRYSIASQASEALDGLLKGISERQAQAILTFPSHECSNGLSGDSVREMAAKYFRIREKSVESKFSTLGGNYLISKNNNQRPARHSVSELILVLAPKRPARKCIK